MRGAKLVVEADEVERVSARTTWTWTWIRMDQSGKGITSEMTENI